MNTCVFPANESSIYTHTDLAPSESQLQQHGGQRPLQQQQNTAHQHHQAVGQQLQIPDVGYISNTQYHHDAHELEDSDSDGDSAPKPKYGKKTRGRVKVRMQFISNKLRRYTTFSKRKTGIMKKVSRKDCYLYTV